MYRFKDDPAFGEICKRFRDGIPTQADFDAINSRLVTDANPLPTNVRAACKTNYQREAINAGTWLQHLEQHGANQGFIIFADQIHVKARNKPDQLLKDLNSFWNNVGEADCDGHREGRFSPMLRLHPNAKVMNVQNTNVDAGLANGTQGTIEKVWLKQNPNKTQIN